MKQLLLKALPPRVLKHLRAIDNFYNGGDRELHYIARLSDPRKTAVDIGANIGVYTYFMRRHATHTYAYEPVPWLVDLLEASYGDDVTVIAAAVSDRAGTAELALPVRDGRVMHELSSLSEDFSQYAETQKIEVPTVRLDDEDIGAPGLIKIEVQQHEAAVIAGAYETLRQHRPNLIVAWAPLLAGGRRIEDAFASLYELDYRGYFLFENRLVTAAEYDPSVHANPANRKRGSFLTNLMFSVNDIAA